MKDKIEILKNHHIKPNDKGKLTPLAIVLIILSVSSCSEAEDTMSEIKNIYSDQDWLIFEACKDKVYDNIKNEYDYLACSEMLKHKKALQKYGATHSYNYWKNRLTDKKESNRHKKTTEKESISNNITPATIKYTTAPGYFYIPLDLPENIRCDSYYNDDEGYHCSPLQDSLRSKNPDTYRSIETKCNVAAEKSNIHSPESYFIACIKNNISD